MTDVAILHNPRCAKSRQTLALLESSNCNIKVIEYLKQAPSEQQLKKIIAMLCLSSPRELMRTKEAEYKILALDNNTLTDDELIQAMIKTPKLIERPIVIVNNKAVIGRPPENVLSLI